MWKISLGVCVYSYQDKQLNVPWISFAKSLPIYAVTVATITRDWGFSTMMLCLPQYFRDILHFDIETVSWCAHIFKMSEQFAFSVIYYFDNKEWKFIIDDWHVHNVDKTQVSCRMWHIYFYLRMFGLGFSVRLFNFATKKLRPCYIVEYAICDFIQRLTLTVIFSWQP